MLYFTNYNLAKLCSYREKTGETVLLWVRRHMIYTFFCCSFVLSKFSAINPDELIP